jgi:hypothetical protein
VNGRRWLDLPYTALRSEATTDGRKQASNEKGCTGTLSEHPGDRCARSRARDVDEWRPLGEVLLDSLGVVLG